MTYDQIIIAIGCSHDNISNHIENNGNSVTLSSTVDIRELRVDGIKGGFQDVQHCRQNRNQIVGFEKKGNIGSESIGNVGFKVHGPRQ